MNTIILLPCFKKGSEISKFFRLKIGVILLHIFVNAAGHSIWANEPVLGEDLAAHFLEKALAHKRSNLTKAFLYADSLEKKALGLQNRNFLFEAFKVKGDLFHQIGKHNEAIFWLKKALIVAKEGKDTLQEVKVINNLGAVYQDLGIYDEALQNYIQATQLGEKILTTVQKATLLSNIALVYESINDFSEAYHYYEEALDLLHGEVSSPVLPYVHVSIGALFSRENKKKEALHHLKVARKYYEKQGNEAGIAKTLIEFANVFSKDNPEVALDYLKLSQKIYKKQQDKTGLFFFNKSAGEAYLELKEYENALAHFTQALQLSDSLKNREIQGDVYLKIAQLYEEQQLFESASFFYRKSLVLEKEKNKREVLFNIANTRANYEIDQKDHKIKILEEEAAQNSSLLRSRNIIINILAGLAVIIIIIAVFYVIKFRKLTQNNQDLFARNKLIHAQKSEIQEQHTLIWNKQFELEKARKKSEEYYRELLITKQQLEEKVNNRTRELEKTHKKLSFHINNTHLAVLEYNSKFELTHWPRQAEIIFGYSKAEVLGLPLDEVPFIRMEDRQELADIIQQLCIGGSSAPHFTKRSVDRYGKTIFIEWSFSVLFDSSGKPDSILTIANDVTTREETYKELLNANQELDTFLYKSSHDLRGPLARMQGVINLGLLESSDPQAHLYFNMLKKVTEELNTLLLRLMMVHNINQHEFKLEELNFADFVDQKIRDLNSLQSPGSEVKVINKVSRDFYLVSDFSLINIILFNLLENGIRFANNFNPWIEIEAIYLPSGKYIISITDNGMGIPAEYKEKIFDMFFQGSTRSTGAGLGLYMVRKAVKKLGGEIKLASDKNQTIFEIVLPAAKYQKKPILKVLN